MGGGLADWATACTAACAWVAAGVQLAACSDANTMMVWAAAPACEARNEAGAFQSSARMLLCVAYGDFGICCSSGSVRCSELPRAGSCDLCWHACWHVRCAWSAAAACRPSVMRPCVIGCAVRCCHWHRCLRVMAYEVCGSFACAPAVMRSAFIAGLRCQSVEGAYLQLALHSSRGGMGWAGLVRRIFTGPVGCAFTSNPAPCIH